MELPNGVLRNEAGALSLEQALSSAKRVEIRPARAPQSGPQRSALPVGVVVAVIAAPSN